MRGESLFFLPFSTDVAKLGARVYARNDVYFK